MKRIAIIGAGASGLTAIKCCLDEDLEPVCYERSGFIGGLWHYTDDVDDKRGCVMKSTVINTSKEMMCYSDFPIPTEYPPYMHHIYVDRYLNLYADNFGLKKHIHLNTEVTSVKRHSTFSDTGLWEVVTRTAHGDLNEVFDGVMVCSGHHSDKHMPVFPGLEKFKGKVIHTHDYKDYHGFEDKNVLIIGIGNSGVDVAIELSKISKQVYLSTRSGAWIFNRVADDGKPWDMIVHTRLQAMLANLFRSAITSFLTKRVNKRVDHRLYSLQPDHSVDASHPTTNDDLPNRIASGSVIIQANIREFSENSVMFEEGTDIKGIDAVVMATGYIFGFPFVDKELIDVKDNEINLYLNMFLPDQDHPTLAVIGCFQPVGAINPVSEMQSRLATRVFKGLIKLPDMKEMWNSINKRHEAVRKRYKKSLRHTIQVDYVPYMDELAEIVGCKPDLRNMFLRDPYLAMTCFFGPCTPYQYRLMGPNPWPGARHAIMTQWERTFKPLRTRHCEQLATSTFNITALTIIICIVAVPILLIYV